MTTTSLTRLRLRFRSLLRDTRGAQMVEYIIIVGAVALLALGAYQAFGGDVKATIEKEGKTLKSVH